MPGRRISNHIRSNVWGVVACFIAVMGTAVVATASDPGERATTSASAKAQIKKLKKRVAALEASQGSARPPSGPAGGDLAGSYPNPAIAPNAVGGAEVANASLTGTDVATDSLGGFDINERSLGDDIDQLPFTHGGLTLSAAQFTNCSVPGNLRVRFDAHTSNDNTQVAISVIDSAPGAPSINLSEDFDASDTALVETNDTVGNLSGRVTVEYTDPLGFGLVDLASVELFFTAVNNAGTCSVTELVGRAI